MKNNFIFDNICDFLYLILIIFLISSPLSNNKKITQYAIAICIYLLFKWVFDYHKCTLSYIECKLRNVKKEDGCLYVFLKRLIDLNKSKNIYKIYLAVSTILILNLYKERE